MLRYIRGSLRRRSRAVLDRGASAVEYGLLVAAVAAVIVAVVFGLGTMIHSAFYETCSELAAGPASLGPATDCAEPAGGGTGGG